MYGRLTLLFVLMVGFAQVAGAAGPEVFDDCDTRVRDDPDNLDSYICYWAWARSQGLWDEAARRLESLLAIDPEDHRARLYLAVVEHDRGHERAVRLYREAAKGLEADGDWEPAVYARTGLVHLLQVRGRPEETEPELQQARRSAEASGDPILLARVLASQGWASIKRADYGRALGLFQQAERASFPEGPFDLQSIVLSGLGRAYWSIGMHRRALDTYVREVELLEGTTDRYGETAPRFNIALLAKELWVEGVIEREDYLRHVDQALDAATRVERHSVEARARLLLGGEAAGEESTAQVERALAIARRIGDAQCTREALRELALHRAAADPPRYEEAYRLLDEAIADARTRGDVEDHARGLIRRAYLLRHSAERETWIDAHLEAIDAVERIRNLQPEATMRAGLFALWGDPYYLLSGLLLERLPTSPEPDADLVLALHTVERLRARVLLEELERAGIGRPPDEIVQPHHDLVDAALHLDPDQALLSFQLASRHTSRRRRLENGGSWVIAMTREETRAFPLPDLDVLVEQVVMLRGMIERRDGSETRGAEQLGEVLLGDVLRAIDPGIRRLVIVPDGCLHRIPFAALRPGPTREPLALHFELSYAPSVTLWAHWRSTDAPARSRSGVLALANPHPGGGDLASERMQDSRIDGLALGPLPHARQEARELVRRLGRGSLLVTGAEASESFVKQAEIGRFGLLHFAAHAVVDGERPERSAVLLAPGAEEEDGMFQMREIVELDLDGHVVLLTSCHSASGRVVVGEGVMSLARAFFLAGAEAVVGSLWPLRDDEAEQLMKAFSRSIAHGGSVAGALADARVDRIEDGAPVAAWAGLVVLGDGDEVPVPAPRRRGVTARRSAIVLLVMGLVAAAAIVSLRRIRRRRRAA